MCGMTPESVFFCCLTPQNPSLGATLSTRPNYEMFGEAGLQHRIQNRYHPEIIKRQVVESYLSGKLNIEAVRKKYQLRSRTQLEQWILSYNGQKEFQFPSGGRKGVRMTMISYQKRKAAVEYCIDHGKDYKATAASFGCTHQQIYGWVRAYHAGGLERYPGRIKRLKRNSQKSWRKAGG